MTTETTSKQQEKDELERPFSSLEVLRLYAMIILLYPVLLGVMLGLGAFAHSYPEYPTPWYGFRTSIGALTSVGILSMTLLLDCPRLLRQRMAKAFPKQKESSTAERLFHKQSMVLFVIALLGMGHDGSKRRDDFPHGVIWGAIVMYACAVLWIIWVMRTNKYAARIVVEQKGQELISTGPYAVVRHPMYMGTVPLFLSLPLTVGSIWPVVPMFVCVLLIAYRTYDEEKFLVDTFGEEYQEYCKKVPSRMIPWMF